jgi:hypothetical protein
MEPENPFLTVDGIADTYSILYERLYNSISDPSNEIAYIMCSRELFLCITRNGVYPFKNEYMYFIPFKSMKPKLIEYIMYCMDNKPHREKTLANNDVAIAIDLGNKKIEPKDILRALCKKAFSNGKPSKTRICMLNVLLQRLQVRLNINNTVLEEVIKETQESS